MEGCVGVATGDMGDRPATASVPPRYTPGVELIARETLFAEGCRGSLTKTLIERFGLRDGLDPQTYAIGVKELWEVAPERHQPGLVIHTIGWPLDNATYGGSFIYHLEDRQVAVGFVIGLDYKNPFSQSVRGVSAVQDASGGSRLFRGRAAHLLWRAGLERGRVPVDPAR